MKNFLRWFTIKPATKAAWLAVFVAVIVNSFVIYQNSRFLETAHESVLLAMSPTIEVEFSSDSAYVLNTSSTQIVDIRIHPIFYRISQKPFRILERNHGGGYYKIAEQMRPKQRITIPMFHLNDDFTHPITDDPSVIRVAVITFRREIDYKTFSDIEIFYAVKINGQTTLFSIFSGKNSALGGSPYYHKQILDEVVKIEKSFFKAENFQ